MILKFKTGKGARGLLTYIAAGADQVTPVFTNMAGSNPRELAREVAALRSLRPKLGKAVGHLILSHDPSQKTLTEAEWREALDVALAEHDAEKAPYAAWMHQDKEHIHLHVFLLRIRPEDGSVVKDGNSYRVNERAARAIEQRLCLDPPKPRARGDRHPRADGARAERGRRRFERLHAAQTQPHQPTKGVSKVINPSHIFSAIAEADDLDDLRKRLAKRGIEAKFVQAPGAAEPTGWLLRQAGPAGTWVKGSDVDRALSLKKVMECMKENWKRRQRLSLADTRNDEAPAQRLIRSGGSLMSVLVGLSFVAAIHLVAGLINLFGRVLARRAQVPVEGLCRVDVDADGTPHFIDPEDLPADASADQRANLDAARTLMSKVLDQATEAIRQDDTSKLPTMADPEVMEARANVIKQLDEIEGGNDQECEPYERERPR